jgi:diguanylate cyclase (GGDEF)-like protein/PAS domain S-box-containing protein
MHIEGGPGAMTPLVDLGPLNRANLSDSARSARAQLYRTLIGNSAHVVLVVDSTGIVLDVTDEIVDKFGYAPADAIGKSAFDFIHPSDQHLVAVELVREIEDPDRNTQSIVARVRHADGSLVDVEVMGLSHLDNPDVGGVVVALRDITGRRVSERVMAAGAYLFTATATVASDAITMFDATGRRVYSSPTVERMFGYTPDELLTLDAGSLVHPDDRRALFDAMKVAMKTDNGSARIESRIIHRNGSVLWVESTFVNLLKNREVGGVVVHMRDIDERHRFHEELQRRAAQDSLTGLGNRLAFTDTLASIAQSAHPGPVTLLYCDLDGFKQINDRYGHAQGDRLLQRVAESITSVVHSDDFVARIGGDEFCVLSRNLSDGSDASELAYRVRDAIVANSTDGAPIGVSIGVVWTDTLDPAIDLLAEADHAMYSAKRQGPNRIKIAHSPVHAS